METTKLLLEWYGLEGEQNALDQCIPFLNLQIHTFVESNNLVADLMAEGDFVVGLVWFDLIVA